MHQREKSDSAVKKRSLSWDDLLTLSTLARCGSFTGAAKRLNLTRATIVRRVQRLELSLGVSLIERGQGEVDLTKAGLDVVATAHEMGELVARLGNASSPPARGISGRVRITAPEGISTFILAPSLPKLRERHPGLEIELQAATKVLSISHKQTDIAIRLTEPTDENLVAVPLPALTYSFYSSRLVANADPDKLASLSLVGYDHAGDGLPESRHIRQWLGGRAPDIRTNSLPAQIEAVRHGAAMALLPDYVTSFFPALVRCPAVPPLSKNAFLVYHAAQRDQRINQIVREWIKARFVDELRKLDSRSVDQSV